MISLRKNSLLIWVTAAVFFIIHFAGFLLFNSYHIIYHEQTQLFLFDRNYFTSFLTKPGGICTFIGAFCTQFCQNSFSSALITTLFAIALFLVLAKILNHYRINGILWLLIPVILLAILQSHYLYMPGTTTGLLLSVIFFSIYISIDSYSYRYISGILGCSLLYFVSGGFAMLAFALCIVHELMYSNARGRFVVSIAYLILCILLPILSSKLIYYIKSEEIWFSLFPMNLKKSMITFFYALFLYLPLLLIASKCRRMITKKELQSDWNWKTIPAGIIVVSSLSFCLFKYAYDEKNEILLRIDNLVQKGEWKKALEYSFMYPGTNQLVLYYGNMAMYKTGQMGDKMFHLPQVGIHGLWLDWKRNEVTPFLGGELYYQLGYTSEAYRWAFESMVAYGENPRSLKRLVVTSIISGDMSLARHYINILNETLFYKKWAQHYQTLINHPELIGQDKEIMEKRHFEFHTDIFADIAGNDIGLVQMLKDHPDDRMAFEYYMAYLLLNKDLDAFTANIGRIKELGYTRIPVHYEEALLVYMSHVKKNIVPAGYEISRETISRLSGYLKILNSSGNNRQLAAKSLFKTYGGTYWFYLNFVNLPDQSGGTKTIKN
jgi:Family of unknown function (DUF6057)